MDEAERARRRIRHRERRRLRRLQQVVPLLFVAAAWMLSSGVVKVMEVPRETAARSRRAPPVVAGPRSLLSPDMRPEMPETLGVSILDHEMGGPPEEQHPTAVELRSEPLPSDVDDLDDVAADELSSLLVAPEVVRAVPQPAAAVLFGGGLVWLAAIRRYSMIARSSTSKVSAAPGGIVPGMPRSP